MRPLDESRTRWQATLRHSSSLADLQRAVRSNGPESPCQAGCRSVCWKAFLLSLDGPSTDWSRLLQETRNTYSALKGRYLQYIEHPEKLAELSLDPLADVPESPWETYRQDEVIRAEILQDVRRLPDEPFYHQESTQALILDVLFVYCKLNPDVGGYRQGMHELLAPIVHVVHQDAVDRAVTMSRDGEAEGDAVMTEMLDSEFVEHDSFALFAKVMENAKASYEVVPPPAAVSSAAHDPLAFPAATPPLPPEKSAIVERSRQIHEELLMAVDPELARHLRSIEILPQIFLIRWIRLLFGREFPFEQLLVLWDTIFALDATLGLVDLICVAMLIRIRWTLLEADYSSALQLLLKYPAPEAPHGPHTFVDDAVYLRDHLDPAGGAELITKYTGRAPVASAAAPADAGSPRRPTTPTFASGLVGGLRPRTMLGGSLSSPRGSPRGSPSASASPATARLVQQQAAVEALFQGAAKGFLERGEKLGLNQAVRDAVGEIRRNVQQGLQEARRAAAGSHTRGGSGSRTVGDSFFSSSVPASPAPSTDRNSGRNRQLAAMLEETVTGLRTLAAETSAVPSSLDTEEGRTRHKEAVEVAAARVQLVQVFLRDARLLLPDEAAPPTPLASANAGSNNQAPSPSQPMTPRGKETMSPVVALDSDPVALTSSTAALEDAVRNGLKSPRSLAGPARSAPSPSNPHSRVLAAAAAAALGGSPKPDVIVEEAVDGAYDASGDRMDTDAPDPAPSVPAAPAPTAITPTTSAETTAATAAAPSQQRPKPLIPTRSSIAQSSFSWMLEPDTSPSSPSLPASGSAAGAHSHRKRPSNSTASRERNAFLFGEVTTSSGGGGSGGVFQEGGRALTSDEIFGLEPLRKALPR